MKARDDTLWWDRATNALYFLNQALLPERVEVVRCDSVQHLIKAITQLEIRGAPALGVAAGYGVVLAAINCPEKELKKFRKHIILQAQKLKQTRPTAINLAWAIDRVCQRLDNAKNVREAKRYILQEADKIARDDEEACQKIGSNGEVLIPDDCNILTHCNAGALACKRWGTALGIVRSATASGKKVHVFACETRPLFQGGRLTAWELHRDGIYVTVIPDSAAAYLMQKHTIDIVLVGADRITNDFVFNKIGTYMHAISAQHHGIPFYVAAPLATFDSYSKNSDVIIEERTRGEVACCGGKIVIPEHVPVINYAFDATPMSLVKAIITEKGIFYPPIDVTKIMSS